MFENMKIYVLGLMIFLSSTVFATTKAQNVNKRSLNVTMPNVRPTRSDQVIFLTINVGTPKNVVEYITKFTPHLNGLAHHISLFDCRGPIYPKGLDKSEYIDIYAWPSDQDPHVGHKGVTCDGYDRQFFAWALDSHEYTLPASIGFEIGPEVGIEYLQLQIHYKDVSPFERFKDLTDDSGLILEIVDGGIDKYAKLFSLRDYTPSYVDKGLSKFYMDCEFKTENVRLYPFSFKVHTHDYGYWHEGYLRTSDNKWYEIGADDPQKPQDYNPIKNRTMVIEDGDSLVTYCDYINNDETIVKMGSRHKDEMCVYQFMFYTLISNFSMTTICNKQWPQFDTQPVY